MKTLADKMFLPQSFHNSPDVFREEETISVDADDDLIDEANGTFILDSEDEEFVGSMNG